MQNIEMYLREFRDSDLSDVGLFASDPDVVRYLSWGPNTIDQTKDWLTNQAITNPQRHYTVVEDNHVIGCGEIRLEGDAAYITYILAKPWWGRGLGKRLLGLLVDKAISMECKCMYAASDIENVASVRIIESDSNFKRTKEEEYMLKGQPRKRIWYRRSLDDPIIQS